MFVQRIQRISRVLQIQTISRFSSRGAIQPNSDAFGIADVTGKDVMGTRETQEIDKELFEKKYGYLNNLNKLDNIETVLHNPIGHVRFDKDNRPKYHAQFDEDNEKMRFDLQALESLNTGKDEADAEPKKEADAEPKKETESIKEFNKHIKLASLVPSEKDEASPQQQRPTQTSDRPYRVKVDTSNVDIYDFRPFKENYSKQQATTKSKKRHIDLTEFNLSDQWAAWIERDSLLWRSPLARLCRERRMMINPMLAFKYEEISAGRDPRENEDEEISYSPLKSFKSIENELKAIEQEEKFLGSAAAPEKDLSEEETGGMNLKPIFEQDILEQIKRQREAEQEQNDESDDEQPTKKKVPISEMTALDYLRKLKNKEIEPSYAPLKKLNEKNKSKKDSVTLQMERPEFDSRGFKNYKHQTLNLHLLNDADRALYLESEIIFNNLGIVVVNKPYGLTCPGDLDHYVTEKNKKTVKLSSFLKEFAQLVALQDKSQGKENTFEDLQNPILYPVYKLDRNCTGVYLLAKNKETAKKVHQLFKERKVSLFYDAITKNVPKMEKASIDIPIEQDRRDPHERMRLRPEVPEKYQAIIRPSRTADKAVTNFKVLKAYKNAAYVELNPLTSIRHQIRAHLGFGLRTPILGDHLYDTTEKVDYQRLPLDVLLNLKIRPTKTMHLPLHLHCKLIILNEFGQNGRDIFLKADLPRFFLENLKSLKLS